MKTADAVVLYDNSNHRTQTDEVVIVSASEAI